MSEREDRPKLEPAAEDFHPVDGLHGSEWETIEGKAHMLSPYVRQLEREGFLLREARGPHGHRMRVAAAGEEREVLMLGSNNYLGLANEPFVVDKTIESIRRFGTGIGGPPMLNGTTVLHRELERELARIKGCEDALLFSSGYAANLGWCTALLSEKDFLIYDSLCHASLHDAMKIGRFQATPFRHNDIDNLRQRLMEVRWKHAYANLVVCVEGVYSMDGDLARLPEVRRLCTKYGALLAVDDAHGLGVMGERGSGTAEHFGLEGQIDVVMGTFSKALASTGGFVATSAEMVDYIRIYGRSYFFSASLPPTIVAAVLAGLEFIELHPERVQRLHENVEYFVKGLRAAGYSVDCHTAIIPLSIPAEVPIRKVVRRLHDEGVFVNGITFPAVPLSMQRLRISMMATFERADLDFAIDKLKLVGAEMGVIE